MVAQRWIEAAKSIGLQDVVGKDGKENGMLLVEKDQVESWPDASSQPTNATEMQPPFRGLFTDRPDRLILSENNTGGGQDRTARESTSGIASSTDFAVNSLPWSPNQSLHKYPRIALPHRDGSQVSTMGLVSHNHAYPKALNRSYLPASLPASSLDATPNRAMWLASIPWALSSPQTIAPQSITTRRHEFIEATHLALSMASRMVENNDKGAWQSPHGDSSPVSPSVSGATPRNQLVAFGAAIQSMFSNISRGEELPSSLSIFIASLLGANDINMGERYHSADEVVDDLLAMVMDPDRFLFDDLYPGAHRLLRKEGKLEIGRGTRLYGREEHMALLVGAFERVIVRGGVKEVVLVCGGSGSGKSTLSEQIRTPLKQMLNAGLVMEKFDEHEQRQPLSVIFSAFNKYCVDLLNGPADRLVRTRTSLTSALGQHQRAPLYALIPNLATLICDDTSTLSSDAEMASTNRFLHLFCVFVRALASPSHPIVLYLDDLQWINEPTLELLSRLITDEESKEGLLFIGNYRDNEVGPDHILASEIHNIASKQVKITDIKVGNLDQDCVDTMLSEFFRLPQRLTRPLSCTLFRKTCGNPHFLMELLYTLIEDGSISYQHDRGKISRWIWDEVVIEAKDIADDVVDLMTQKMRTMDNATQALLKMMACLGSSCEEPTLRRISPGDYLDTLLNLEVAICNGLICKTSETTWKFSHDRVHESSYSLLSPSDRKLMHLTIGRRFLGNMPLLEVPQNVCMIVDHIIRGKDLITDHSEGIKMAELCLAAGKKAKSTSTFSLASFYFCNGTRLLDESDWDGECYGLALELFSSFAHSQYVIGKYDEATATLEKVFAYGKSLLDKMDAWCTHISVLVAQRGTYEAVEKGVGLLFELGESFPRKPEQKDIGMQSAALQTLLKDMPFRKILEMDLVEDREILAKMHTFGKVGTYSFRTDQKLCSLIFFRMAILTLRHGICRESPAAFAAVGIIFVHFQGQHKLGDLLGRLAVSLVERHGWEDQVAKVNFLVCRGIFAFNKDLHTILLPLKKAAESGISFSEESDLGSPANSLFLDFESAAMSVNSYIIASLQCGRDLQLLRLTAKSMLGKFKGHSMNLGIARTLETVILTLVGEQNGNDLLGNLGMTDIERTLLDAQQRNAFHSVLTLRMSLAIIFRKYDVAAVALSLMTQDIAIRGPLLHILVKVDSVFYSGLTAAAMSSKDPSEKWMNIVRKSVAQMEGYAEQAAMNYQHKLCLLNAEMERLGGHINAAAKMYDESIRLASTHGFGHEAALAAECAAIFHRNMKSSEATVTNYFSRSRELYVMWGATAKVSDLIHNMI